MQHKQSFPSIHSCVCASRQIVLDDNDVIILLEEGADGFARMDALFHVQVRRRLVKHVDVGLLYSNDSDRKTLQLAA